MDWAPTDKLRRTAREVTRRLFAEYQQTGPSPGHGGWLPPVDELMLTLLSQSTSDINSRRCFTELRERFADWDAVADAPEAAVETTIHGCGLSHQKAARMQAILHRLRAEHGRITLDFLAAMPPGEALAYLLSFHGVGRKTASCVLLFSLALPALPVDTHVLRVSRRLALIPDRATADAAHDMLEALLPADEYLPFHVNMIAHGRRTCAAQHPACERCVLLDMCPEGQKKLRIENCEL